MPAPQIINHLLLGLIFILLFASFRRKVFFPCAYLLIMMNRPGLYYPILGQLRFELIVAIWGVILITSGSEELFKLKDEKIVRYMWFFLLVIFLSMLQSFSFFVSWEWVYEKVLPNVILVCLLLLYCKTERDVKVFLWIFIISSIGLGYESVYRYVTGDVVSRNEAGIGGFQYAVAKTGRAENHNSVANFFLSCMPVLWYLGVLDKKKYVKFAGGCLFAFSFAGVLISGSRGGLVGLVVLIIVMALLSEKPVFFFSVALVILVISVSCMGSTYLDRIGTILNGVSGDTSSNSRIMGLTNGIEMMIKRPIFGVGPGCYPVARKAWFGWGLWAHNHYGQLAGELGVIGVVVWFRFAKEYILRLWRYNKLDEIPAWVKSIVAAFFVTSVVLLALGMFDHSLYHTVWYIMAAIIVNMGQLEILEFSIGEI